MYAFLIGVTILLPQEQHRFNVYSPDQYAEPICMKSGMRWPSVSRDHQGQDAARAGSHGNLLLKARDTENLGDIMLRDIWREVRDNPPLAIALFCMLVLVGLLYVLPIGSAHGHDHSRPELNQWFKDLRASGSRAPCCDGSDATSLEDPDWDMKDGHYRVRLDGEWVNVPDEAVVTEPNRYGKALVWPYTGYQKGVRCFMPGSMT